MGYYVEYIYTVPMVLLNCCSAYICRFRTYVRRWLLVYTYVLAILYHSQVWHQLCHIRKSFQPNDSQTGPRGHHLCTVATKIGWRAKVIDHDG